MKTKNMVQTFIVEESKELIYDTEKITEWKEKCEALGLVGQLELSQKDKSPIPFESMNSVSERVYKTLCPEAVDFRKYRKTAIPLEVLGLIQLAESEHYFAGIEIWYDDKTPDPLAVGFTNTGQYGHRDYFIIARWGDVLRPFEELKEMAIYRYRRLSELKLKTKINECKTLLDNLEVNTAAYFEAENRDYDVVGFL